MVENYWNFWYVIEKMKLILSQLVQLGGRRPNFIRLGSRRSGQEKNPRTVHLANFWPLRTVFGLISLEDLRNFWLKWFRTDESDDLFSLSGPNWDATSNWDNSSQLRYEFTRQTKLNKINTQNETNNTSALFTFEKSKNLTR